MLLVQELSPVQVARRVVRASQGPIPASPVLLDISRLPGIPYAQRVIQARPRMVRIPHVLPVPRERRPEARGLPAALSVQLERIKIQPASRRVRHALQARILILLALWCVRIAMPEKLVLRDPQVASRVLMATSQLRVPLYAACVGSEKPRMELILRV